MDLLQSRGTRAHAALALGASVLAHALAFASLIGPSRSRSMPDLLRLLPALYRYAPDRQPTLPREVRLALPAAPSAPVAGADSRRPPVELELVLVPPAPEQGEPALPPGVVAVDVDTVFSMIAVDSEVERDPWSAAPVYPEALLSLGLEGEVEAEFVVDTTGWVDLASVRLLSASHEAFGRAVEEALPGMHFRPAWRGPRKVRQRVTQRFAFRFVAPPAPRAPAAS